jgi:hypothetical protein
MSCSIALCSVQTSCSISGCLSPTSARSRKQARPRKRRMQKQLAQMTAARVAAEKHLSKLTMDEASVEKVMRDTPM